MIMVLMMTSTVTTMTRGRQGINFSPALGARPDSADKSNAAAAAAAAAVSASASASAAGNGETGETLHTTTASGNAEGAETKSSLSMSIMELFDTSNGAGTGANAGAAVASASRIGGGTPAAAAAAAAVASAIKSPLPRAPHAWNNVHSLTNQSKTAPPSTSTGGSAGGGRASLGSVGGAERHGYLSFSEVQVRRVCYLSTLFLLHACATFRGRSILFLCPRFL